MMTMMTWPALLAGEQLAAPEFGLAPTHESVFAAGCRAFRLEGLDEDEQVVGWAGPSVWPSVQALFTTDGQALEARHLGELERTVGECLSHAGWRDERFSLIGQSGRPVRLNGQLLGLERSLFRPLGLLSESVQLNLYDADGQLWISQRSWAKAIDPGLWDAAVAGGLAMGEDPQGAVIRESWEEAGLRILPEHHLRFRGMVRVCRLIPVGLHLERVWVFSAKALQGFVPHPQDGEVQANRQVSAAGVRELLERGLFNHEAAVATLTSFS